MDFGEARARTGLWRQVSTLARRQVRLVVADRRYFLYLALMPFIVGLLPLAVAGHVGFNKPLPDSIAPFEPKQLVVLLNLGAIYMGTALTIREVVGERTIFRREQAAGLSTSAYVLQPRSACSVRPRWPSRRCWCWWSRRRSSARARLLTAGGVGQSDIGTLRRSGGDLRGLGGTRPCGVGVGAQQQSGAAAHGGDPDGAVGAGRRLHPGHGHDAARPDLLVHPCEVGTGGHGIDR